MVITIIGILAGLLISVISMVLDKAKSAESVHNLRQIGIGLQSLISEAG